MVYVLVDLTIKVLCPGFQNQKWSKFVVLHECSILPLSSIQNWVFTSALDWTHIQGQIFEQIEILFWEIRKSQWIPSLLVHYAIFYFGVTHCKGCTLQASSAMLGWPGEMGATSSSRTTRSSQMASFQFTVVNPLRLWSFFFHQQYFGCTSAFNLLHCSVSDWS